MLETAVCSMSIVGDIHVLGVTGIPSVPNNIKLSVQAIKVLGAKVTCIGVAWLYHATWKKQWQL